jgi:thiamine pyrophosphokinase
MNALVLAGGRVRVSDELRRLAREAECVIAADSGLRHAAPLDVVPDLIVGDFDSASPEDLARYPEVPKERHPPEKDALDLELALEHALARGAKRVSVLGSLGGRLDQTLATILIAARLHEKGTRVSIYGASSTVHFLRGGETLALELEPERLFSALSLAPESTLSIENAHYPLRDYPLAFGVGLGVSNAVAASPLKLELSRGLVAVVVLEDA